MNDDEKFLTQFQEPPRPEFAAALYQRINRPMNSQRTQFTARRMALSFTAAFALLVAALMIYPPTQAQAIYLLRRIGVFTITAEQPPANLPTAEAPNPGDKPLTAQTAAEAARLAGFPVLNIPSLPNGYEMQGPFSILNNGSGKVVVSLFANAEKDTFLLVNQYHYGPDDAYTDYVGGTETIQDVLVRGLQGVWITGRMMTSPIPGAAEGLRSTGWLRWEENETVYVLISDGLSLKEMQNMAESMK